MREGQLEKVVGITAMDIGRFEGNATFFHAKEELLSTLVQSYNHPEPSIPMFFEEPKDIEFDTRMSAICVFTSCNPFRHMEYKKMGFKLQR